MQLARELAAGTGWALPFNELADPIGIAVSGGGDSVGMLHAMHAWAVENGRTLRVATVDHGLRAASRAEAEFVANLCANMGVGHDIVTWSTRPNGNLQAAARAARYDLLANWAKDNALSCVMLGHTEDDVAETFLMRLARGSGVDGLAQMQAHRRWNGVLWVRPMLKTTRGDIRTYLGEHDQDWIDDPSNDDDAFDRVKARAALAALEPLGLTKQRLNDTGVRMSMARDALQNAAVDVARHAVKVDRGDIVIDLTQLVRVPVETQLRIIAAGLCFVSSNRYRPRMSALTDLYVHHHQAKPRTLHGALVSGDRTVMRISREYNAVKSTHSNLGELWDGRWNMDGPVTSDCTIRALGDAINYVADWRDENLPRASVMATPAVFSGDRLLAAPVAGLQNGFSARIVADFDSFLLSR